MAAVDRIIGKDLVVHFLPEGGTPGVDEKVLTSDFTVFEFNLSRDTTEAAAGNETVKYPKGTLEGMDWSVSLYDADQAYIPDIQTGERGLLTVYKEGIGSGLPYFSFNTEIFGFSESLPFNDLLEIEVSGERQGAMVADFGSVQ